MNPWVYRISLALLLAVIFYWLYPNSEPNPRPTWWNIDPLANQPSSTPSILGLHIAQHSIQDAILVLKVTPSIAMFTTRQRQKSHEPAMNIEAYFEDLYDEGDHVIIGLDADATLLQHIKKIAFEPELFPNDVIRVGIPSELIKTVYALPIKSITVIAGWQVNFETFKKHFGKPSELIDDGQGNAHFLYPQFGLDFIQPAGGLQVLQFVAAQAFEQDLRAPLMLKATHIP